MLSAYLDRLRKPEGGESRVREVRLICKEHMQGFYRSADFQLVGPSPVVHWKDQWHEMAALV